LSILKFFKEKGDESKTRSILRAVATNLYSGKFDLDDVVQGTGYSDQRSLVIAKKGAVLIADAALRFDLDMKIAVRDVHRFAESIEPDDNTQLAQLFIDSIHALNGFQDRFKGGKRAKKYTFENSIWRAERNAKWPLDEKSRQKLEGMFAEINDLEAQIERLEAEEQSNA
jgi:hypothetical protein